MKNIDEKEHRRSYLTKPNFNIVERKSIDYSDEIKKDKINGMRTDAIMEKYKPLGASYKDISTAIKESGYKRGVTYKGILDDAGGKTFFMEAKSNGFSIGSIARYLGCSSSWVTCYCKKNGFRYRYLPGKSNSNLIMTDEIFKEIKENAKNK